MNTAVYKSTRYTLRPVDTWDWFNKDENLYDTDEEFGSDIVDQCSFSGGGAHKDNVSLPHQQPCLLSNDNQGPSNISELMEDLVNQAPNRSISASIIGASDIQQQTPPTPSAKRQGWKRKKREKRRVASKSTPILEKEWH